MFLHPKRAGGKQQLNSERKIMKGSTRRREEEEERCSCSDVFIGRTKQNVPQ